MEMHVRKDPTLVYANIGVHAGVEITPALDRSEGEGAAIHIGHNGPKVIMDLAAGGARRFRDRIATNDGAATSSNSNLLISTGAAR